MIPKVLKNKNIKILLPGFWILSTIATSFVVMVLLLSSLSNNNYKQNFRYTVYAANPLVLGEATTSIDSKDARATVINKVYSKYNCPMSGLGEAFVEEADENGIPFWIVPAIAFQESSCGKQTPLLDGEETYNAYGWGVWGDNVVKFDDWEHGIGVLSRYINERFYEQGVTDPCEIMKIYTPPSNGSWCAGIEFFKDEMVQYETPEL